MTDRKKEMVEAIRIQTEIIDEAEKERRKIIQELIPYAPWPIGEIAEVKGITNNGKLMRIDKITVRVDSRTILWEGYGPIRKKDGVFGDRRGRTFLRESVPGNNKTKGGDGT